MSTPHDEIDAKLSHRFLEPVRERLRPKGAPSGRAGAVERFLSLELPGPKDEEWRFVRLRGLAGAPTQSPPEEAPELESSQLREFWTEEAAGRRLVFVDGAYSAALSDTSELGEGVEFERMTFGQYDGVGQVAAHLQDGQDYFVALHEALWEQGAALRVGRDVVGGTVQVLFVSTGSSPALTSPRVWAQVGAGSKVTLIEQHVALGGEVQEVANVLVEADLAANARMDHVKVQRAGAQAQHVARTAVRVAEGAHYASVTASLGAAFSRHDLHAEIDGGNTNCEFHGLAVLDGQQVSDTHSVMNHVHAHAGSDQLHKCIIGGRAHAVFNGKIFVRQGAQQIDAFQLNRNLLLSDRARVDTKPQLEIFADDVKCTHGATIGQLEDDQLFYIQTRAIDEAQARGLLTYAFAAEVLERIQVPSVQRALSEVVAQKAGGKL